MTKVQIDDVIEHLEFASELNKSFLNKNTGEIHLIPEELERYAEPDFEDEDFIPEWEKEIIPVIKDIKQNPAKYIEIPNQFYINEYAIMERFCLSLKEETLRDKMYSAIKGSGAFQRFKDNIHNYGIVDDWYKYKEESFREIAIEWCKENDLEYY